MVGELGNGDWGLWVACIFGDGVGGRWGGEWGMGGNKWIGGLLARGFVSRSACCVFDLRCCFEMEEGRGWRSK